MLFDESIEKFEFYLKKKLVLLLPLGPGEGRGASIPCVESRIMDFLS